MADAQVRLGIEVVKLLIDISNQMPLSLSGPNFPPEGTAGQALTDGYRR